MLQEMNDLGTMWVTKSLALSADKEGSLICIRGSHVGQRFPLKSDKTVFLGRDASQVDFVITDGQVSRKHCAITYIAEIDKYRVIDYSLNGCYMKDGKRLERGREYYLSPADELYLGNGENLYQLY